jgi:LysR family transcriptional regulator, transcriptional activator of the cysJI operon
MTPSRTNIPEIGDLRAFCVAVDLGSISRAGRRLYISQPALSKRIRNLERMAGTQLLVRTPAGVRSTAAGQRLYPEARRMLVHAESVGELLGQLQPRSMPARLAASHTITEYLLANLLAEFQSSADSEHFAVEVISANSSVVQSLVRDGRADIGLCALDPGQSAAELLVAELFCEDEVVLAVPLAHPWARRSSVSLKEFLLTPMVMRDPAANSRATVEAALAARELTAAHPLSEVGSTAAAKSAARERGAPVLTSSLSLTPGDLLQIVPIQGLQFKRQFALLIAHREDLHRSARLLAEFLVSHRHRAQTAIQRD